MIKRNSKKKGKKIALKDKQKTVKVTEKDIPKEENNWNIWAGRPKKMTDHTIQKLKLCFAVGMTDLQASYFCWISKSSLYLYQSENPEFLEEKEILKDSISMQARLNIWWNIKSWDTADSKWWLTMKDKDFMNKLQLHQWSPLTLSEEDKVIYEKILKNNLW